MWFFHGHYFRIIGAAPFFLVFLFLFFLLSAAASFFFCFFFRRAPHPFFTGDGIPLWYRALRARPFHRFSLAFSFRVGPKSGTNFRSLDLFFPFSNVLLRDTLRSFRLVHEIYTRYWNKNASLNNYSVPLVGHEHFLSMVGNLKLRLPSWNALDRFGPSVEWIVRDFCRKLGKLGNNGNESARADVGWLCEEQLANDKKEKGEAKGWTRVIRPQPIPFGVTVSGQSRATIRCHRTRSQRTVPADCSNR